MHSIFLPLGIFGYDYQQKGLKITINAHMCCYGPKKRKSKNNLDIHFFRGNEPDSCFLRTLDMYPQYLDIFSWSLVVYSATSEIRQKLLA